MARSTASLDNALILPLLVVMTAALSLTSLTGASIIDVTSSASWRGHHSPHAAAPSREDLSTASTTTATTAASLSVRIQKTSFTSSSSSDRKTDVTRRPKNSPPVACPAGQFYSSTKQSCSPCSTKCPPNQIIRRTCSAMRDTVCGPFPEFDKFRQTPDEDRHDGGDGEYWPRGRKHHGGLRRKGGRRHHNHHNRNGHHNNHASDAPTGPQGAEAEPDLTSMSLDRARSQWRSLSIALIIVLSIVCCFVVGVGMYVCIACRRSRSEQKMFFREPELLTTRAYQDYDDIDAEPRYVQMYFPSDRNRNLRTPRHLPVYQQIYTGSDYTELPSLFTSSTTRLTEKTPSTGSGRAEEGDGEDQYMYFNLPTVSN